MIRSKEMKTRIHIALLLVLTARCCLGGDSAILQPVAVSPGDTMKEIVHKAAHVTPSE